MKVRPRLALVVTAILVSVCRCDGGGTYLRLADGENTFCNRYDVYFEANAPSDSVFYCSVSCPNGDEVTVETWYPAELGRMTATQIQAKYCPAIPSSTEPPATEPPPTEPPATDPPPIVYPPILTGEVVSCNLNTLKISLHLLPGVDLSTLPDYELQFNGQSLVCAHSTSNVNLLDCDLPSSIVFPATLTLLHSGDLISEFPFDHSVCTIEDTSSDDGGDEQNDNDDEETPDEGSPPDCIADPFNPGC